MDEIDKIGCVPDSVEYTDEFKDWFDNSRKDGYLAPNPYHYWKQHNGHLFLRKFALKLFIHAGSSVACERFFSVCKYMADDRRSSMTPENFTSLCIDKANIERARKILNFFSDIYSIFCIVYNKQKKGEKVFKKVVQKTTFIQK